MKKIKKFIYILLFILIICLNTKASASEKREGIENFPESYKPYLYELKSKYPNWNFTALYTGLDWNYVIRRRKHIWKKPSTKIIFRQMEKHKTRRIQCRSRCRLGRRVKASIRIHNGSKKLFKRSTYIPI